MTSSTSGFDPRLMAEAQAGANFMANQATKTNVVRPSGTERSNAGFPAQISSTDPQDQEYAMRKQIVGSGQAGSAVVPGVGVAVAGEDYFRYAQRKMNDQEEAAYKAWVMSQADFTDPASAEWWNQRVPWLTQSRTEYIDYVANLQKQAALISLRGPQTDEDFRFLFGLKNGTINVPDQPLHKLNEQPLNETYQAGFFSPFSQRILDNSIPPVRLPRQSQAGIAWSAPLTNTRTRANFPLTFFSGNANPMGPRVAPAPPR